MKPEPNQEQKDWCNMELHFLAAATGFDVSGFATEYQDSIVAKNFHETFKRYADLCAKQHGQCRHGDRKSEAQKVKDFKAENGYE